MCFAFAVATTAVNALHISFIVNALTVIEIDFLEHKNKLQIKEINGKKHLFDPIRKKYLVLAPEEMVRQLVIQYFLLQLHYNPNKIASEKELRINGLRKRCDILLYDDAFEPYLLVECKAPQVKINQSTFQQAAIYNLNLQVPYLMVTNGIDTFCCAINCFMTNLNLST